MKLRKLAVLVGLVSSSLFGQYKMETGSTPPEGVASAVAGALDKQSVKVVGPDGVLCEIWLRATPPPGTASKEDGSTWAEVAHGSLVGVVNFPKKHEDRRGQGVAPGVYTMRLSYFPINGDHQGVAPQRDFLVLSKAAEDSDPGSTPKFDDLIAMSRKVSGTPHPAVFSMWKVDNDFTPGFAKMGESDWALQVKVAGTPIAIILIGKVE